MKKFVVGTMIAAAGLFMACSTVHAYNFGDYRSATLVSKAWQALAANDMDGVLAYTNKCFELYEAQAKKMQEGLQGYATGTNDEVFAYWALNDVATAYYIQGEAYRAAGMMEQAKVAYQKVTNEFTYGQCWDAGGWFWKPAEAAKEKVQMIAGGSTIDFGDYRSSTLVTKAWQALAADDLAAVKAYVAKALELYEEKAKEMQASLTEFPWESNEKIFTYWALNDVGTSLFVLGEAYSKAGDPVKAADAYKKLVDEFYFAQCWDTNGWFWKPSEAAENKLAEMAQ